MALDLSKFPIRDPAESARIAAERQAAADDRLAMTAQAIAKALPDRTEGQVANAAGWCCRWLPEAVWTAFDHSPYPIDDDVRDTLSAYRTVLQGGVAW